jgi:ATP-binding protein involved in chromosome partitioning
MEIELFGSGGGEKIARELDVRFLGKVPIDLKTRELADRGRPTVLEDRQSIIGRVLVQVAEAVTTLIEEP